MQPISHGGQQAIVKLCSDRRDQRKRRFRGHIGAPGCTKLKRGGSGSEPMHVLKVAVAGFGSVGRATALLLLSRRGAIADCTGRMFSSIGRTMTWAAYRVSGFSHATAARSRLWRSAAFNAGSRSVE